MSCLILFDDEAVGVRLGSAWGFHMGILISDLMTDGSINGRQPSVTRVLVV